MGNSRLLRLVLVGWLGAVNLAADPLSKSRQINFFRDATSRQLNGLASRSDGRLLNGPAVTPVKVDLGNDLLWSLSSDGENLLVGTGPNGKVLTLARQPDGSFDTKVEVDLEENHIFSLARLPDGGLLVGTSPTGALVLVRKGAVVARAELPVDSILDLSLPREGTAQNVLVATGNPGRIFQVDLAKFATAGISAQKLATETELAAHGVTLFGSVRDDNLRRLIRMSDGRVIAGSAPRGNIYSFPVEGGAPIVLAENRNAEVADLLAWDGGFFAAVTFTSDPGEKRVKVANEKSSPADESGEKPAPDGSILLVNQPDSTAIFRGHSQLMWFPDGGYPEVVATQTNHAFYRLQRWDQQVLITGGEEGDLFGYDPEKRRSLVFPAATSAQVNGIVAAHGRTGAFYVMGNNPGSLDLVNFSALSRRQVTTKRIDLGVASEVGALRFEQIGAGDPSALQVELRASFSSDELEGWGAWKAAQYSGGGWQVGGLKGRYVQLRLSATTPAFELAGAQLYSLPQNRRPELQTFRVLSSNFALIPAPDAVESVTATLGQVLQGGSKENRSTRSGFLSSQIVPQMGTQVILWTVTDADADNLVSTFSIQGEHDSDWTDLAVESNEPYVQFEVSHLPEGLYRTRLIATETAPRPIDDRLSVTFETDDFLIDRTPPVIHDATLTWKQDRLWLKVRAVDARSLLAGLEIKLNNGMQAAIEHPADGILDSPDETFAYDFPAGRVSGSTSVELVVYDAVGNSSSRRLPVPKR